MNCKFCNAELNEGEILCPVCGKENIPEAEEMTAEEVVEVPAEETAEQIPAETTEETPEETPEAPVEVPAEVPKKKNNVLLIILAAIGALALVAVLAGAIIYGVKNSAKKADTYVVSDQKAIAAQDTVIATAGNQKLTNSELQVYYKQAFEEFYNYFSYYMDLSTMGLDTTKPLSEQYYDEANGVTWESFFVDSALDTWHRYAALTMQAEEDGFVLRPETQTYLDTIPQNLEQMAISYGFDTAEAFIQSEMSVGCDMEGYLKFLNSNYFAGEYFDSLYDSMVPTMEEMEAYYAENEESLAAMGISKDAGKTVDVRHILITPKGGTEADDGSIVYSDDEWEACRAEAQALLDQWLAEDGTEEGFAQFAMTYTEDPGSMTTGGLYTDVYVGQMVAPFEDWCFAEGRAYGDYGLVQTNYGYHIMYFVDEHEIWVTNVESEMINERCLAVVEDAIAKWPVDVNYKKIVLGESPLIN